MPMKAKSDQLAAIYSTLGAQTEPDWFMDIDTCGLEVYVTPEKALVILDRSPLAQRGCAAWFRKPKEEWGGTKLDLVGELEMLEGLVWHGVYSGLLGGTAVMMDQYVRLHNGVPLAMVRVITRVNGSPSAPPVEHERYVELLMEASGEPRDTSAANGIDLNGA